MAKREGGLLVMRWNQVILDEEMIVNYAKIDRQHCSLLATTGSLHIVSVINSSVLLVISRPGSFVLIDSSSTW